MACYSHNKNLNILYFYEHQLGKTLSFFEATKKLSKTKKTCWMDCNGLGTINENEFGKQESQNVLVSVILPIVF